MKHRISVVIPTYNEEANVVPLWREISRALAGSQYEVIYVDDGSTDRTIHVIERICEDDKRIRVIQFRSNYGQTAALRAGILHATGNVIVTLDADLQNDPTDIPKMLAMLDKGYDVVCGWRYLRRDPLSKKIPSALARFLRQFVTGEQLHDMGCSLKVFRSHAVKDLVLFGEMHRYIPTLLLWKGYSITEVKVNHRERKHGITKYGWGRIFRGGLDLISAKIWMKYSTKPFHLFGTIALVMIVSSIVLVFYNVAKYGWQFEAGPTLILAGILLILSAQFITFGFISDILVHMYYTDEKPYKIKKTVNFR